MHGLFRHLVYGNIVSVSQMYLLFLMLQELSYVCVDVSVVVLAVED